LQYSRALGWTDAEQPREGGRDVPWGHVVEDRDGLVVDLINGSAGRLARQSSVAAASVDMINSHRSEVAQRPSPSAYGKRKSRVVEGLCSAPLEPLVEPEIFDRQTSVRHGASLQVVDVAVSTVGEVEQPGVPTEPRKSADGTLRQTSDGHTVTHHSFSSAHPTEWRVIGECWSGPLQPSWFYDHIVVEDRDHVRTCGLNERRVQRRDQARSRNHDNVHAKVGAERSCNRNRRVVPMPRNDVDPVWSQRLNRKALETRPEVFGPLIGGNYHVDSMLNGAHELNLVRISDAIEPTISKSSRRTMR
jgi:hypothetical protein